MKEWTGSKHLTLEKFLIYYKKAYSYKNLNHNEYTLSAYIDLEVDRIIAQVNKYVWSEHLESPIAIVQIPSTWWQHFKQDKFPTWLIKKFPVKYDQERIEFERRVIYPRMPIDTDKRFMDWHVVENINREYLPVDGRTE